jgi:pSer/pThr/pTyr-binding forkhead associated (FHA) protein
MTRTEALVFLGLPEGAGIEAIEREVGEKYAFFRLLYDSAPTEILRRIHAKNLEKLEDVRVLFALTYSKPTPQNQAPPPIPQNEAPAAVDGPARAAKSSFRDPIAGFLITHTENKATRKFDLFAGENIIGRALVPGHCCIVIEDDAFVSRVHAIITVRMTDTGFCFYLSDDGRLSKGKRSQNGTYVNASSALVHSELLLQDGDTIQVGTTKMVLKSNKGNDKIVVEEVMQTSYVKTIVINIL